MFSKKHLLLPVFLLALTPLSSNSHEEISISKEASWLSKKELSKFGDLKKIKIEGKEYSILPSTKSQDNLSETRLIDASNKILTSYHQVSIVDIPTEQVRISTSDLIKNTASITYIDSSNITLIRFNELQEALDAFEALREIFPRDKIGFPIHRANHKIQ